MSIILDALKKSESDQQRQSGPALFEVKVAPPKARFPVWAIAIVALLVVNMSIVGYLLLRRPARGAETAVTTASSPPAASSPNPPVTLPRAAAPTTSAPPPGTPPPMPSGAAAPGYAGNPPPGGYPQPNSAPNNGNAQTYGNTATYSNAPSSPPPPNQFSAASNQPGAGAPERPVAETEPTLAIRAREAAGTEPPANADDYAPATEPDASLFKGHVRRGTDSGLVLYQDAAVVPGANIPQLRLDLHVYAPKPQDRFALINMRKLREGDSLPEGVRVESITPDGVIMSHNGSRFLLPRE